jgi:hypothetical protein
MWLAYFDCWYALAHLHMRNRDSKRLNEPAPNEITKLLEDWVDGFEALYTLIPLVYDELHRLAYQHMRWERAGTCCKRRHA